MRLAKSCTIQKLASLVHPEVARYDASFFWPCELSWREKAGLHYVVYTNDSPMHWSDDPQWQLLVRDTIEGGLWTWYEQDYVFRMRFCSREQCDIALCVWRKTMSQRAMIVAEINPDPWKRYLFWTGSGPIFSIVALCMAHVCGLIIGALSIFNMFHFNGFRW